MFNEHSKIGFKTKELSNDKQCRTFEHVPEHNVQSNMLPEAPNSVLEHSARTELPNMTKIPKNRKKLVEKMQLNVRMHP